MAGYANGTPDGPRMIFGKENLNWSGPKRANESNLHGDFLSIKSDFSPSSEPLSLDDKYAAVEEALESGIHANALEWITNYAGYNEETLDYAAEELGVDFDGYESLEERYEMLEPYVDHLENTSALEWVTNYSGYNDEVVNWAAQEVGLDFDLDDEDEDEEDFDIDDDIDNDNYLDYDDYEEDDYQEYDFNEFGGRRDNIDW